MNGTASTRETGFVSLYMILSDFDMSTKFGFHFYTTARQSAHVTVFLWQRTWREWMVAFSAKIIFRICVLSSLQIPTKCIGRRKLHWRPLIFVFANSKRKQKPLQTQLKLAMVVYKTYVQEESLVGRITDWSSNSYEGNKICSIRFLLLHIA